MRAITQVCHKHAFLFIRLLVLLLLLLFILLLLLRLLLRLLLLLLLFCFSLRLSPRMHIKLPWGYLFMAGGFAGGS